VTPYGCEESICPAGRRWCVSLRDDTASLLLEGVLVLGNPLHQRILARALLDVVLDLLGALGHLK